MKTEEYRVTSLILPVGQLACAVTSELYKKAASCRTVVLFISLGLGRYSLVWLVTFRQMKGYFPEPGRAVPPIDCIWL